MGDCVQLQQLVFNLVLKGIESMDNVTYRPRKLAIRTTQQIAEHVLVEIRDSGVGLKDQEKVFDAFFNTKVDAWAWDWRQLFGLKPATGDNGLPQRKPSIIGRDLAMHANVKTALPQKAHCMTQETKILKRAPAQANGGQAMGSADTIA